MDAISLVMFIFPAILALIFTLIAIAPKGRDKSYNVFSGSMVTFLASLVASICWFVFGLTWPAVATTALFVTIAYLSYALGIIFAVFTITVGVMMMRASFDAKKPRLTIQKNDDGDD